MQARVTQLTSQIGDREMAPYTVLAGLIKHQGGKVYAVFDEGARAAAKPNPASQAYWVNEVLERKADQGIITREFRRSGPPHAAERRPLLQGVDDA